MLKSNLPISNIEVGLFNPIPTCPVYVAVLKIVFPDLVHALYGVRSGGLIILP